MIQRNSSARLVDTVVEMTAVKQRERKKKTIQEMSTVLEASGTTSHILAFAL